MEERQKKLHAVTGSNLRDIVNFINDNNLLKEDLFTLSKESDGYTLLYYK